MSSTEVPKGKPLLELQKYLKGLADDVAREAFADSCGCSFGHLRNCAYGYKPLAEKVCALVEKNSGGEVSRRTLRPDDWFDIWPELAQKPANREPGEHASAASHPGRRSTDKRSGPDNRSERRNG